MANQKISYRKLFSNIAESKGYKLKKPTYLQRKNSIDIILEGQSEGKSQEVTIDIKKRNGKNANQWVYIEYKNAKGGDGWLYGESQFIVFETASSFIFVPRKSLISWLNSSQIVRWDLPYVDQSWKSKYRLFRRPNTLEIISQIKVSDLFNIKGHKVWKKS